MKNYDIIDIDDIFSQTNKSLAKYLCDNGLNLSFDFKTKYDKNLYTHYFITNILIFLKNNKKNVIFYNNILTKDIFRIKLIKKIKSIFGFKIYSNVWCYTDFLNLLSIKSTLCIDEFEQYIELNTKPKSLKHIKKYLNKEGFLTLTDTVLKDIHQCVLICS